MFRCLVVHTQIAITVIPIPPPSQTITLSTDCCFPATHVVLVMKLGHHTVMDVSPVAARALPPTLSELFAQAPVAEAAASQSEERLSLIC